MGRQLLICMLLCCTLAGIQSMTEPRPPSIYIQPAHPPSYNVYFKSGESVDLPCEAVAIPNATYSWTRNGFPFIPTGFPYVPSVNEDRIMLLPDVGTLHFTRAEDTDEQVYQCFASNDHGLSASNKVNLQEAKLAEFQPEEPITYRPQLGAALTLHCVPPDSTPAPDVYWVVKDTDGNITTVKLDQRVTMDHESRLRITHVKLEDEQGGKAYHCMAKNDVAGKTVQGPDVFISTHGVTEEQRPVSYMWASASDYYGLRGEPFKIKCIFAGNPTPDVHWVRDDNKPLPNHTRSESFGQELVFDPLEFSDQGDYTCFGSNSLTPQPAHRTMSVRVESRPYWIEEPQDLDLRVGGDASFKCLAGGVPEPYVYWYINNIPLWGLTDPRIDNRFKKVNATEVTFTNLTLSDDMVIQCNATNKHGYIWGEFNLNVVVNPPTKTEQTLIG